MVAILGPIERLLEWTLYAIHDSTGLSWAWSIIALTAVVRIAILPLTAKQTLSMKKMQQLQPYVKQLQGRYKDDRQELNQRLLEFYRDNRANPAASCLPILIQIPIFIALFFTLRDFKPPAGSSPDLSFLGGFVGNITVDINDAGLAGAVLVVVYVVSQLLSTKAMATAQSPQQMWLFYALPIVFVPFILSFPIGVMLYWITTNLWTMGQYLVVVRFFHNPAVEVILPRDDKRDGSGSRRVVKAGVADKAGSKQGKDASTSNRKGAPPQAAPRRNKRRR
jgi:YidC/Oxa1 family membrane protein insertase